jgi:ATP phosphoribosyltransferase
MSAQSPLSIDTLRIGLPSGSLQKATVELFDKAGYKISVADRSVFPKFDDAKISSVLFRAQEISRYIVDGIIDCGLTGYDWIVENGNLDQIHEICTLEYSRASSNPAKWVLAVPEESKVNRPEELSGAIIATELVNTTRNWFKQKNIPVTVEFSWGTTEIKARILDAIVDITETGSSIRANNLRVIDTILSSTTRFVASKKAWEIPWKREKMENLAILLQGAISARSKIGLKMNLPADKLGEVSGILPAEKSPTVSQLNIPGWVAIEVILEEKQERELIPRLKRIGATGIISYPLNKVIP